MNEANKNPILTEKALFQSAQRRHFSDGYFYHIQEWEKVSKKQVTRSFDYREEQFRVNYYRFFHADFQKTKLTSRHNNVDYVAEDVLVNSWNHLQLFSLIAQTRLACEIEYQKIKLEDKDGKLNKLEELDIAMVEKYASDNISLKIYFDIYKWLKNRNFKDVTTLEILLPIAMKNINLFTIEEQLSLIMLLYNCVGKALKESKTTVKLETMIADLAIFGFQKNIFKKSSNLDLNFFLGLYDNLRKTYPDKIYILKNNIDKLPNDTLIAWTNSYIEAREAIRANNFDDAVSNLLQLAHLGDYTLTTRKYVLLLMCIYESKNNQTITSNNKVAPNLDLVKIVESIAITFKGSNYTKKMSTKHEHQTLFNFIAIYAAISYQTHTIYEIKKMIENNTSHLKQWLESKLTNYQQISPRSSGNKLKTYNKILNLLPLEDFNA